MTKTHQDEESVQLLNNNGYDRIRNNGTYDAPTDIYNDNPVEIHQQQEGNANKNRLFNLALIAFTTPGTKFFKSAQSSFQEYLMEDEKLQMSATTYGLILTLISMPVVPLIGGVLLDYKGKNHRQNLPSSATVNSNDDGNDDDDNGEEIIDRSVRNVQNHHSIVSSLRSLAYGTKVRTNVQKAAQSDAFCLFLVVTLFGIVVYGFGLETFHSIPIGLLGAAIFGVGEGCIMVAARAFVGHEFLGGDGAFAQGVLIAMNNFSMMASKNIVPWLIEHEKRKNNATATEMNEEQVVVDNENSIAIGILACFVVQLISVFAGLWYAYRCGSFCGRHRFSRDDQQHHHHNKHQRNPDLSRNECNGDEKYYQLSTSVTSKNSSKNGANCVGGCAGCARSGMSSMTTLFNLPLTFWIVATARAIFLVTFKVFSRYSNSFLIEKYDATAVMAGRKSSVNELFALFSPLVGFLAYRSPGGIVSFVIGAGILGAVSIGSLAFLPPEIITEYLPGGNLTPLVGISIAHGIIVPISIAMIPHTVPPLQLGMAFAVVEVLGNTLNLTDIVFGYLRDVTGDYDAPMRLLFVYALLGTTLLLSSRHKIGAIGIGRLSIR